MTIRPCCRRKVPGYDRAGETAPVVLRRPGAGGRGGALVYQAAARERDYRLLLARGDAALRDDQTFGAIEDYSGAIALRPDSMLAHLRRGETYQRRGDLEAAARDFRTAAALDPSATRPLEELGDVLYLQQRSTARPRSTSGLCGSTTARARVTYKLALARYRDGNLDGALAALDPPCASTIGWPTPTTSWALSPRQSQIDRGAAALEKRSRSRPDSFRRGKSSRTCTRRLGRRGEELEQLQLLAGLDRDRLERQIAVGLAHAHGRPTRRSAARRAGHADLAVLTLGSALERTPGSAARLRRARAGLARHRARRATTGRA